MVVSVVLIKDQIIIAVRIAYLVVARLYKIHLINIPPLLQRDINHFLGMKRLESKRFFNTLQNNINQLLTYLTAFIIIVLL